MEATEALCDTCNGRGWLHVKEPFEIHRCDVCLKFDADDEAREAHRDTCGCHWPEVDFQALLLEWINDVGKVPTDIGIRLESAKALIADRTDFRLNTWARTHTLLDVLGAIMNHYFFWGSYPNGIRWDQKFLDAVRGATGVCAQIIAMCNSRSWNSDWLLGPGDGMLSENGGWYLVR